MKSIELSYNDIRDFKHLKVKNLVRFKEYLGLAVISLSNGDVVESRRDGRFVSQLDGYSTYEEVFIWDSEEEMKIEPLGFIRTM